MKTGKYLIAATVLLVLTSFTFLVLNTWEIGPGYSIRFDGKYAHGTFQGLKGTIIFDPGNLDESRFDVTVDVASIDTGTALKNKHAKSEKWFDAEQYPEIRYVSSKVTSSGDSFLVIGKLQIKDISKEVQIPFTFDTAAPAFHGTFKVNRGDFGIGKTSGKDSDSTSVEIFVPVLLH